MKANLKSTTLMALLAAASLGLNAEDLQYAAKFGAGAVVGAIGEQGSRATMNAAFVVELPLAKNREVFCEVNYRLYNSVDHDVTKLGTGYNAAGATGNIVATSSVDVRKDNLSGYGLSAGYRQQFRDTNFWWQGGLTLASMTSQQEVTGTITVLTTPSYVEGLNFTPAKHTLSPGLFVGGQFKVGPNFFVETNLTALSYQQVNYVPLSYTGKAAHVDTSNKVKLSLDVNVGFRF